MSDERPPLVQWRKREPREQERGLLRREGAEVDVLLLVRGEPATRWRGRVVRNDLGLVTLAPWGCTSEIVFEEEQASEVFPIGAMHAPARRSIETTQSQRVGRMRGGR